MEKLIQWYPGHIAKALRELRERVAMVDCVIELVDARMPISSHFAFVDEVAGHKQRIIVINKIDLAPHDNVKRAIAYWAERGFTAVALDVPQRKGLPELKSALDKLHVELSQKMKKRGRLPRKLRTMVMGLPNVGKSSLINALVQKRSLKVGDKPGVTRAPQWIGLGKNLELLDTPGVIPPKFEDQSLALKLALIGSISEYAADPALIAEAGLDLIREQFPGTLLKLYDNEEIRLEELCVQRGYLQHGGSGDMRRAAESVLQDLRHARQGRISLESVFLEQAAGPTESSEETDLDLPAPELPERQEQQTEAADTPDSPLGIEE